MLPAMGSPYYYGVDISNTPEEVKMAFASYLNVLGSSSILTCQNSKFEFRIFVWIFQLRLPEEYNNKYSKFDTSKSMSHQGHKLPR